VADWQKVRLSTEAQSQYLLVADDLIINRVNSPSHLGKSLVVTKAMEGAVFESNMMRLRLTPSTSPSYVQLYLSSDAGRRRLISHAKWAVNQASINQTDVSATVIPMVAFEEQQAIVRRVGKHFAWIDHFAAEAANARKLVNHLDQAILTKAFRGELVPQDPNDEPASVLLERIRAERAAASNGRKRNEKETSPKAFLSPKRRAKGRHHRVGQAAASAKGFPN
jgi:type I restriction enzyme S subunit